MPVDGDTDKGTVQEMKQCTVCQKELPTSLDEFGPAQVPLCRDCYFECGPKIEDLLQNYFYPFHLPKVFEYLAQFYDVDEFGNGLETLLVDLETGEISPRMIIK